MILNANALLLSKMRFSFISSNYNSSLENMFTIKSNFFILQFIVHYTLYIVHCYSMISVITTFNTKMMKLETTMPCVLALPSSKAPPSMR